MTGQRVPREKNAPCRMIGAAREIGLSLLVSGIVSVSGETLCSSGSLSLPRQLPIPRRVTTRLPFLLSCGVGNSFVARHVSLSAPRDPGSFASPMAPSSLRADIEQRGVNFA